MAKVIKIAACATAADVVAARKYWTAKGYAEAAAPQPQFEDLVLEKWSGWAVGADGAAAGGQHAVERRLLEKAFVIVFTKV
ncbi:MAG: hypothetical protein JNL41_06530 [Phenylobacterium sp.]|uniref:hypothetical protein n=1 Tax=Phenylobacterium sp. TaxID=1871053 RepID=UPI001A628273|nr:hypothetical protein [Phenylobacterium sp.]MBL8553918.1 hypothetical protein [Phenylobacterium sp.]